MDKTGSCLRIGERGAWMKVGEGISQRTYIHNPWTQTTVWGLPEGRAKREIVGTTIVA